MSERPDGEQVTRSLPESQSGWSPAASPLEDRLRADEARLARDEALITADEARLVADEKRLAAEERTAFLARRLSVVSAALAVALGIAVAALVIGAIALRRDVDRIAAAAPDGSVSTSAIQDGAVTAAKLADGSVTRAAVDRGAITGGAVASGAITASDLAAGAVTTAAVPHDALTGADILESALGVVPSSEVARDAKHLGGSAPSAYLSLVRTVQVSSATGTSAVKGPLTAGCPSGTRVISGGAAVEGPVSGIAITRSAPAGSRAWLGAADSLGVATDPWRLVVTAVCATGGG